MRCLAFLILLSGVALAAHLEDNVHLPLLGSVARPGLRFHSQTGRTAPLLYVTTQQNVIAALHPRSGEIAWRQQLDSQICAFDFEDQNLRIETPAAALQFNAISGHFLTSEALGSVPSSCQIDEGHRVAAGDAVKGAQQDGAVYSSATETVTSADGVSKLSRTVYATEGGTLQLWRDEQQSWIRQDGLADLADKGAVAVVDFTQRKRRQQWHSESGSFVQLLTGTAQRVQNRVMAAQNWFGSLLVPTKALGDVQTDWLSRTFGFKQMAIVATPRGKVLGLDLSARGSLLWQMSVFEQGDVCWLALKELATSSDAGSATLAGLAQVSARGGSEEMYGLLVDAMTGRTEKDVVFRGSARAAFASPVGSLVAIDPNLKAYSWPRNAESSGASIFFHVHQRDEPSRIDGYVLDAAWVDGDLARPVWTYRSKEEIDSIVEVSSGTIASIGRVLGDRDTLYKYLNPHMLAALSKSSIVLLDGVSGAVIFSSSITDQLAENSRPVAALSENWLVYAFADTRSPGVTTRIVSVELYHHSEPNNTFSSFMSTPVPKAYSRSFVYPRGVKALAFTQTKRGIATKNLLITTDRDSIVSLPRRLLDPRRPFSKPSKQDAEEGLIGYDPLLPLDPRFVISAGARVMTSDRPRLKSVPTLLESTSLVLSLGGDFFVGRASPSGTFDVLSEEFNKVQLFLVMSALALGILFTRPLVKQKKLRAQWYVD